MRLHALPAEYGDCLWLEYGDPVRRVLIDGGTKDAWPALRAKIHDLPESDRTFELLVITHVDVDHIAGVLELLRNRVALNLTFKDIWFNGWVHLKSENAALLGPVEGEELTAMLADPLGLPWNKRMHDLGTPNNGAVVTHEDETPRVVEIDSNLKLTILSPTLNRLAKLDPVWVEVVKKHGLVPGHGARVSQSSGVDDGTLGDYSFDELLQLKGGSDGSKANGSCIALLAEADGTRMLLAGDAFKGTLTKSVRKLAAPKKRLALDLFKLSHHGSMYNISKTLLKYVECRHFLVCTNGDRFEHPNDRTIAWTIRHGRPSTGDDVVLHFNYCTDFNKRWGEETLLQSNEHYMTRYPDAEGRGIVFDPDEW